MPEFVLLFRASEESAREAMGTPERAQRSLESWLTWVNDLERKGHRKNPGMPLDRSGKVVRGAAKTVTDGPFVEAKDMVLGFFSIEARDIDEAVQLASNCPMVLAGGSVEVRPVGEMPAPRS